MSGPDTSPGYWLHHAALVWRQACERRLGELTYPQFNVLSAVSLHHARNREAPTQQQVAEGARMDRMMASKLIIGLEQRGLLIRAADTADARVRRLTLTAQGRTALRACIAAARAADAEVFDLIPDVDSLVSQLRSVAEQRQT
jgi:DNA-binding MarR family transcriptional regulator